MCRLLQLSWKACLDSLQLQHHLLSDQAGGSQIASSWGSKSRQDDDPSSHPATVILSPIRAPSGGITGSHWVWSVFDAHRTRPDDKTSRTLPGFTFLRTRTLWFCICSRVKNFASPLTTCLTFPSQLSISSTYRASAPGCFHTFLMSPTRMSSTLTFVSLSFFFCAAAGFWFLIFLLEDDSSSWATCWWSLCSCCAVDVAASAAFDSSLTAVSETAALSETAQHWWWGSSQIQLQLAA